ncbi:MAG TPA: FAD-dependent oxidoreductase, partial [Acidimicrobiia bacterium]|nr:FAD-dependent oxidoreductase [Acidimicrobiia bacterium]
VLEARDRVGGRVWTKDVDGIPIDIGGTWLGPGQDFVYDLVKELGLSTYATHTAGETVFVHGHDVQRYKGQVPKLNPITVASLGLGMARLDRMAKKVPLDEPWVGSRAPRWDGRSMADWIRANVPEKTSAALLGAIVRGLMTCDPSEVSLLHMLYLVQSARGLNRLLSIEGGYQQDMVKGGAQSMANIMADELGPSVRLSSPVRAIHHDDRSVVVESDGVTVRAGHAIVATPPALAHKIDFTPGLPIDRAQVLQRMPAGCVLKTVVVYDRAFWRDEGLRGETVALGSSIESTLDASPPAGTPGELCALAFGPMARRLTELGADARRDHVLGELTVRFGPKARHPRHYVEVDWAQEQWSEGCYLAHLPPGVLTQYGHVLRAPAGRIHWAGTETATVSHGSIDGAIRSGVRAAQEILATN